MKINEGVRNGHLTRNSSLGALWQGGRDSSSSYLTALPLSSEEFATKLFQKHNVAVVPGSVFGAGGEGHIRCCYATAIDKIKVALDRIADFVQECRKN